MTQDTQQEWIDALRSGEYEQTRNTIRDDRGMCCLGVLCDIVDPEGWETFGPRVHAHNLGQCGEPAELDVDLLRAAGISREDAQRLVELNDVYRASFDEIADWLEDQQ